MSALRLGHTGPDNETENDNGKNARPLIGSMNVGVFCVEQFNQSRACIFIVLIFVLGMKLTIQISP